MNALRSHSKEHFLTSAPVSMALGAFIIIFFILDLLFESWSLYDAAYFSYATAVTNFEWWRFLSGIFSYSSGQSLLTTLLFFVFIAPILERSERADVFLKLVITAVFLVYLFWSMAIFFGLLPGGASFPLEGGTGIGAAVMTALYLKQGNQRVSLIIIEKPFLLKNIILIFAAVWLILTVGDTARLDQPVVSAAAKLIALTAVIPAWLISRPNGVLISSNLRRNKPKNKHSFNYKAKIRPRVELARDDSEVDEILDKISAQGFQNLTSEEKNILRRASEE